MEQFHIPPFLTMWHNVCRDNNNETDTVSVNVWPVFSKKLNVRPHVMH